MIKEGDCVVIYAAGARDGGKQFIGYATVAGRNDAVTSRERAELLGPAKEETSTIISILRLSEVFLFEPAVKIQSVKAKLSFIRNPDSPKWGSALQGGAVSITRDDFNSIARLTNSKPFSKNISRQ